ncbi:DUF4232 domain-containing protein [Streptomyces sp. NBC_00572]|uniref:DUF4232 domain-containing protein n=1 Tax=Streptomyces sp. NBC_00572 TaxID=2903664 RepID=UPI00224EEB50|nr:DUF4232 domain-containing protein [Streptomyces sp. NBC_00572]MCX4985219.1 DUF4232 domain-containing protein [Streptomyces sp. NBC_00572]
MRHACLARHTFPAAVAGLLLVTLTACGTERQGAAAAGSASPPACGPGASPAESADVPQADIPGASASPAQDGVTIIGTGGGASAGAPSCAVYSVTSRETEPFTYVVTVGFVSESGQALVNVDDTVQTVAPGRTVRRTVTATGRLSPDAVGKVQARIVKVRSFPTAETPSVGGTCPPTGVRVYADEGDAAMGLRVVGLHLENCGTRSYRLNGYPRVEIRDEDHERVDGVSIVQGGDAVAGGTGADGPPQQLVLEPGERAHAGLVWRNTVEGGVGDPVNAPYARVWAKPGAAPVTVTPELDLGTTGKLGVGPWKKDGEQAGGG